MDWNTVFTSITEWALNTGIKIVIAILILIVSFIIINFLAKRIRRKVEKSGKLDTTIGRVLVNAGKILAKCLVVICLVGYLGINTSALSALVASAGVCIGLAVNGALGNIAGGILLLVTRPFKVDDFVEIAGHLGTVEDIRLCNTKLRTLDNKVVYIPNGAASTSSVTNYSEKDLRRVDIEFSISYDSDVEKAKSIIAQVASANEKVLADPEPFVRVLSYDSSAVKLVSRSWVNSADYWDVFFYLTETVRKSFDENGIKIPFNQVDVHIKNDGGEA